MTYTKLKHKAINHLLRLHSKQLLHDKLEGLLFTTKQTKAPLTKCSLQHINHIAKLHSNQYTINQFIDSDFTLVTVNRIPIEYSKLLQLINSKSIYFTNLLINYYLQQTKSISISPDTYIALDNGKLSTKQLKHLDTVPF